MPSPIQTPTVRHFSATSDSADSAGLEGRMDRDVRYLSVFHGTDYSSSPTTGTGQEDRLPQSFGQRDEAVYAQPHPLPVGEETIFRGGTTVEVKTVVPNVDHRLTAVGTFTTQRSATTLSPPAC